jgi:hypothetical protein
MMLTFMALFATSDNEVLPTFVAHSRSRQKARRPQGGRLSGREQGINQERAEQLAL